jgi:glycosyltransferase involved in cell wall biosynthesis
MMVTAPQSVGALMRGQVGYLAENGFDVTVLCGNSKHLESAQRVTPVPLYVVSWSRDIDVIRDIQSFFQVLKLIRRTRPTIAVFSTPKAGLVGSIASFLQRVPRRVYILRGLRYETSVGRRRAVLRFLERVACACSHRVVCVSPSLRDVVLSERLAPESKVVVLGSGSSNGVDSERFARTEASMLVAAGIRAECAIPADAFVVGFIGRINVDKGVIELLTAFAALRRQFRDVYLVIAGEVESQQLLPEWCSKELQEGERVHCLGLVSDSAIFYSVIDALALPTYREGFPNVVLEAGAAARAVVTTRATGAIDSVIDGVTGLVCEVRDAKSLQNSLETLILDRDLAERMGLAARDRVLREFSNERVWQNWSEFLRTVEPRQRNKT